MNVLVKNGILSQIDCGYNTAFIINRPELFSQTEYMMLRNEKNANLAKCMKLQLNGKPELMFMNEGKKHLSSMARSLNEKGLLVIAGSLIKSMNQIENHGFLSCEKLDLDADKILIDVMTLELSLIYLPLSAKVNEDSLDVKRSLADMLDSLIAINPALNTNAVNILKTDLASRTYAELMQKYPCSVAPAPPRPPVPSPKTEKKMTLISQDPANPVSFSVDRNQYVLGRKAGTADGVISFNPAIGRKHCMIFQDGSQYKVVDLESSNHTYLNGTVLVPNQAYELQDGDVIRLANSDFKVSIR